MNLYLFGVLTVQVCEYIIGASIEDSICSLLVETALGRLVSPELRFR